MLSTSNTTCLLKTSATVCGTLMAAPVAGCLYGQAIRLTAVPFNGVVYHSRLDARDRSYPSSSALNDMLVGLRRSLAGVLSLNFANQKKGRSLGRRSKLLLARTHAPSHEPFSRAGAGGQVKTRRGRGLGWGGSRIFPERYYPVKRS